MRIILNKHIDLANHDASDMKLTVSSGSSMTIQTKGMNGSLKASGKNIEASETIDLYAISNTFAKVSSISSDGIYNYDVSGIDNIELEYAGNAGDIYIKVVD